MGKNIKAIRHGDLVLVNIGKLPKGILPSQTKTLMQGSGGNNHDVSGATFYPNNVDQYVFGYIYAGEECHLLHPDHGDGDGNIKTALIPAGIYELRRQFEHQHSSMTQVID